jgi:hypothetical protein
VSGGGAGSSSPNYRHQSFRFFAAKYQLISLAQRAGYDQKSAYFINPIY